MIRESDRCVVRYRYVSNDQHSALSIIYSLIPACPVRISFFYLSWGGAYIPYEMDQISDMFANGGRISKIFDLAFLMR